MCSFCFFYLHHQLFTKKVVLFFNSIAKFYIKSISILWHYKPTHNNPKLMDCYVVFYQYNDNLKILSFVQNSIHPCNIFP